MTTENSMAEKESDRAPAPLADSENPAIVDAAKTFKITMISAILFVLAALFIILRTRLG